MPNVNDVLAEVRFLAQSGLKDIAAVFANPDSIFVFVLADANPSLEDEIAAAINSGSQPACVFGWSDEGKLRCRALPEYRNSEKQIEILCLHKAYLIRRLDGTNPV
jgi:hypothetical protein